MRNQLFILIYDAELYCYQAIGRMRRNVNANQWQYGISERGKSVPVWNDCLVVFPCWSWCTPFHDLLLENIQTFTFLPSTACFWQNLKICNNKMYVTSWFVSIIMVRRAYISMRFSSSSSFGYSINCCLNILSDFLLSEEVVVSCVDISSCCTLSIASCIVSSVFILMTLSTFLPW